MNWVALSWLFDSFILADETFAKVWQRLENCLSVNNYLCGKLVTLLESPIAFDKRYKVTVVLFFIPDFNLLRDELDNFIHLKSYIQSFYNSIKLKQIYNTLTVSCKESKLFLFVFLNIENIVVFPSRSRFPVKLICCITFASACLLKQIYCYQLIILFEIWIM